MILSAKDVNGTVEITAIFSDPTTGADATPDTSIVIDIYPANSNTQTITATAMTVKDSVTGWYKYAWDTSGVTAGTYLYKVKVVHDSVTYSSQATYTVTDTNIDGVDAKVDIIDTNVDSLVDACAGSIYAEYKQDTTAGNLLKGIPVWLTLTATKSPYATNPKDTNDNGLVWWYLKAGTYYVWTAGQSTYTGTLTVVSQGNYSFTQNSEVL